MSFFPKKSVWLRCDIPFSTWPSEGSGLAWLRLRDSEMSPRLETRCCFDSLGRRNRRCFGWGRSRRKPQAESQAQLKAGSPMVFGHHLIESPKPVTCPEMMITIHPLGPRNGIYPRHRTVFCGLVAQRYWKMQQPKTSQPWV